MTDTPAQQEMFGHEPPRARKRPTYRETSREAYRSFTPVSGALDKAIVEAIREAGPGGIICEQIEFRLGGRKHQSVSGNLSHLVARGIVRWNGMTDLTSSNRKARKWVLAI